MITKKLLKTRVDAMIDAAIEVASAHEARDALLAALAVAKPQRPARIEISDGPPAAPALQLAAAARLSLERRGAFAGFGSRAAAHLTE